MIKLNSTLRIIELAAFDLYAVSKIINIVLFLQVADTPYPSGQFLVIPNCRVGECIGAALGKLHSKAIPYASTKYILTIPLFFASIFPRKVKLNLSLTNS